MISITLPVFEKIINTVGAVMPEAGGIISAKDNVIDNFVFDRGRKTSSNFYIPDTTELNRVIQGWEQDGCKFAGLVHSHGIGKGELSESDIEYAMRLRDCFDLDVVYMLLLTTDTKQHELFGFECYKEKDKFVVDKRNIKII